jgi:hypothetical protein
VDSSAGTGKRALRLVVGAPARDLVLAALGSGVNRPVAVRAQGNEIACGIVSLLAPPPYVMRLDTGERAAGLASPAISLQNLLLQPLVCRGIHRMRGRFGGN